MSEKEKVNPFELYNKAAKSWFDLFGSWAEMGSELPTVPKAGDISNWSTPFNNFFGDWNRIYSNFMESMQKIPYEPMKDLNEAVIDGANAYVKIYNAWVNNMDKVVRKGYEVSQGLLEDKEVDPSEFFDTIEDARRDIVNNMVESLEGTPFESVEYVKDAQDKFLESFSGEEEKVRTFYKRFFETTRKLTKSWNSMLKEANEQFTPLLKEGELTADAYRKMIENYKKMYKESLEVLEPYSEAFPENKEMIEKTENWLNKYLDVTSTWYEMMLNSYEGVEKSSQDIYESAKAMFSEGEVESVDELTKKWSEVYEKATSDLMEVAQFSNKIPDFADTLIDYVNSTNDLYRAMVTPPQVSESEMNEIKSDIENLRDQIGEEEE